MTTATKTKVAIKTKSKVKSKVLTKTNAKVGQQVILKNVIKAQYYSSNEQNPVWGDNGLFIVGTITDYFSGDSEIRIQWDNGKSGYYFLNKCEIILASNLTAKQKAEQKKYLADEKIKVEIAKKRRIAKEKKDKEVNIKAFDKLVLPKESKNEILSVLKQHENQDKIFTEWGLNEVIKYGKGMTFLFYGSPGTGKTWGANCISQAIDKKLLIVSSAEIQTSEPGGANRNIKNAFTTAKKNKQILFLDECDSLICQRDDVGIIIGSEINTLLTEIEQFDGVLILATNRISRLDEALERRISLIIEFTEPDFEQRQEIWEKLLPKKMPLAKEVSLEKLAEYKLTGGQIKNAILQSARFACAKNSKEVKLKHFTMSIDRILKSKNLLGKSSSYKQTIVSDTDISDTDISINKKPKKIGGIK